MGKSSGSSSLILKRPPSYGVHVGPCRSASISVRSSSFWIKVRPSGAFLESAFYCLATASITLAGRDIVENILVFKFWETILRNFRKFKPLINLQLGPGPD